MALLVLASAISLELQAATVKTKPVDPRSVRSVSVPLTQSQIAVALKSEKYPEVVRSEKLAVLLSSWHPQEFEFQKRAANTSPFRKTTLPGMSFAFYIAPVLGNSSLFLRGRVGADFYSFEREGSVDLRGVIKSDQQKLYIVPFPVGLEASTNPVDAAGFSLHLGLTVRPTVLVMTNSLLAYDSTSTGIFYEGSFEAAFLLGKSAAPEISLGITQSVGQVEGIGFSALGIQGGVRFSI